MTKNYISGEIYVEMVMQPGKLTPDGWRVFTQHDGKLLREPAVHAPLCMSESEAEAVRRVWQQIKGRKNKTEWLWELRHGHQVFQDSLKNPVA